MRSGIALFLVVSGLLACSGGGRDDTDTLPDVTATPGSTTSPSTATTGDPTVPTSGVTDPGGTGTGVDSIGTSTTTGATTGDTTVDPATGSSTGDDPGMVVSIEIEPLDAVITVIDGAIPAPIEYKAVGVTDKGVKVPVTGTWDYDRPDLANIGDQSGLLGATGLVGGKGNVSFDGAGDLPKVSTTASVKLVFNSDPDGVPPEVKDQFGMAVDPDPAMALLYPYDKTVFPRGLTGPVIQWNGGGANDTYYIHAFSEYFEFKGWQASGRQSKIL